MKIPAHVKKYKDDFIFASRVLALLPGQVDISFNDYELWKYTEIENQKKSVCILFYPHKTSAGNYHVRVRDLGSANKERADEIMWLLKKTQWHRCTFTRKM